MKTDTQFIYLFNNVCCFCYKITLSILQNPRCLIHFLFFIHLQSLLFIFTSCPIFILPSIFATLMPPLTFSSLFCNLFRSPLSLIFHNSRVLRCPSSHLKVPLSCICLILLLQQHPALIPAQWQNSYWCQWKWGSWSIYGFAQYT